ncbi:MAG: metallophosphoesterase [Paracoccaceae bacterium]
MTRSPLSRFVGRVAGAFGRRSGVAPGMGLFAELPGEGQGGGPIWAVGDVHGCLSLYREIEDRIAAEARATGLVQRVVLLGDVIDRGPEVRGVLGHLMSAPPDGILRACLLGNHEDMLLRFLARPREYRAWLSFGGWPTLGSYGIVPDPGGGAPDVARLAANLKAAMGAETIAFLKALPPGLLSGPFVLAHAGVAPQTPLARQTRADLIWTRHGEIGDLLPPPDLGERIVVHGHTPVEEPVREGWRINIDTGAFATGRLTAVRLVPGEPPRFLTTGAP